MKYFRLLEDNKKIRLLVQLDEETIVDLTSIHSDLTDIIQIVLTSNIYSTSITKTTEKILNNKSYETYKTSAMERRRESDTPDVYSKVYSAKRPEIFLKSTADRCSNPFESIGIRKDSQWNVPEPELAIVLYKGAILGYTIGNDVSSRSIEGENPLYLPQAKIYDKSCSIGPCIIDAESISNYEKFNINCKIIRNEKTIFNATSSVKSMNKSIPNLIKWLKQSNTLPIKSAFLTGTGIVPPPEFTLLENDQISISINEIGTLNNSVIKV